MNKLTPLFESKEFIDDFKRIINEGTNLKKISKITEQSEENLSIDSRQLKKTKLNNRTE